MWLSELPNAAEVVGLDRGRESLGAEIIGGSRDAASVLESGREQTNGLRVLMVLPVDGRGRMAAVERQIRSIAALGIEVEALEIVGRRRLKYLTLLPELARRSKSVDLIHAHYGYCGWFARANVRKPVVVSFMGSDLLGIATPAGTLSAASRIIIRLDQFLAKIVDAVIVKSPEMAMTISSVKSHVIPNGVDLDTFTPIPREDARAELGWDGGRRVLFPGCTDEARKGFELARRTVERAAHLLGEPVELVPLCGVAAARVPLYLNACDALLMTSFWEGSPNAVKEAMACNLPVVSVPVGDVAELLAGVSSCVVCSRDPEQLARSLADVIAAGVPSDGRHALQQNGLDLETAAKRVSAVYDSVLNGAMHGRG
jgi:glycosyltransferase involved in cell wall biosynthesis